MNAILNIMSLNLPFMVSLEKRFPSTIGYIYCLIATFLFALTSLFISKARHIPTLQLAYYRFLSLVVIMYINNRNQKISLFTNNKRLNIFLICVGLTTTIGLPNMIRGFQLVPLSEAVVILQIQPVVASILAVIFLKEKCDFLQFLSTIFCTIGVLMIAKPEFLFTREVVPGYDEASRIIGIVSLIIGAVMITIQSLIMKSLVKSVSSSLSVFYVGLVPALLSTCQMLNGEVITLTLDDWIIVTEVILAGYFAIVLYNRCFRFADAGKLSVMGYSEIIFGYILDIFVVGTSVDFYSTIGAAVIFCCFFVRIYQTLIK